MLELLKEEENEELLELIASEVTEIDEKLELPFQLSRMELWEEKIGSNEDLVIIIGVQLNEFKL